MIDLNLVPENLRKKRKSKSASSTSAFQLPREAIVALVGGLLTLLILAHGTLLFITWRKMVSKKSLENEWQQILPSKDNADKLSNELRTKQGKITAVEKITTSQRILWAPKLNAISDSIPRGVWINKITFEEGLLLIEGSAVSKLSDEMISVGNFASGLKKQKNLMENFGGIEVGSIQRRKIQAVEIADFSITAKIK